eukprot:snap_masked-scaffold_1-processed-gene-20.34-mRNA-1 protein AED:1.00 eAED:1.00 QI:0/-1/0/0/-1/1/1/0/400
MEEDFVDEKPELVCFAILIYILCLKKYDLSEDKRYKLNRYIQGQLVAYYLETPNSPVTIFSDLEKGIRTKVGKSTWNHFERVCVQEISEPSELESFLKTLPSLCKRKRQTNDDERDSHFLKVSARSLFGQVILDLTHFNKKCSISSLMQLFYRFVLFVRGKEEKNKPHVPVNKILFLSQKFDVSYDAALKNFEEGSFDVAGEFVYDALTDAVDMLEKDKLNLVLNLAQKILTKLEGTEGQRLAKAVDLYGNEASMQPNLIIDSMVFDFLSYTEAEFENLYSRSVQSLNFFMKHLKEAVEENSDILLEEALKDFSWTYQLPSEQKRVVYRFFLQISVAILEKSHGPRRVCPSLQCLAAIEAMKNVEDEASSHLLKEALQKLTAFSAHFVSSISSLRALEKL